MNKNLDTARFNLILRTRDDLNSILFMSDLELSTKYSLSTEKELLNERQRTKRLLDRNENTYVLWDIQSKSNNLIVGNLGFHNLLLQHKRSEIGYWCKPDWRSKGVITESLNKVIIYGFEEILLNRIEAYLDVDNIVSEKVLLKCNFSREGLLREHYIDHGKVCDSYVYSLLKADYLKIK